MTFKYIRTAMASGVVLITVGCDKVRSSPQIIEADGHAYVACHGLVWVSDAGGYFSDGAAFKITFTDSANLKRTIWGVTKLSVSEPPAEAFAPFPSNLPDPKISLDQNGEHYRSGAEYTWPDGTKAKLNGDRWQPVPMSIACE